MKNRSIIYVLIISIFCVGCLFYVEQVMMIPYIYKTILKIPMFIILPYIVKRIYLKEKMNFTISGSNLKWLVLLACSISLVIIIAYLITQSYIDTTLIVDDFNNRMKISKTVFVFAALYTIFANSFIEEYFFRGFIFQTLDQNGFTKLAYIISSLLFAIYHIGIFMTWFSLPIMMIVLLGLFIGGIIFSYFVKHTGSILASYIIHLSADISIVLIGLFGINLFT